MWPKKVEVAAAAAAAAAAVAAAYQEDQSHGVGEGTQTSCYEEVLVKTTGSLISAD